MTPPRLSEAALQAIEARRNNGTVMAKTFAFDILPTLLAEIRAGRGDQGAPVERVMDLVDRIEGGLRYSAPMRCSRCMYGFVPSCPCVPSCRSRADNHDFAMGAVVTLRARLSEPTATPPPSSVVKISVDSRPKDS